MSKMFDKNVEREIERGDSSSDRSSSSSSRKSKRWISGLFKRAKGKESSGWRLRLRYLWSAFKWKRINLQLSFFDDVLFKIVYVLEAIVLVMSLSFFFLFCGCHF